MITVINNFNESTEMYDGTLQEAASQFVLEANQLVNDFSMDLLLTEHKYLYEHGEQLDWVTEADDNGGLKIVSKVKGFFSNIAALFQKIYNNIVAWIHEHIGKVITFFKSIQYEKADIRKAFDKADTTYSVPAFMSNSANIIKEISDEAIDKFVKDKVEDSSKLYTRAGQFYESLDAKGTFKNVDAKSGSKEAGNIKENTIAFLYESNAYVNEAKRTYKAAVSALESAKKRLEQNKSMSSEEISEGVSGYKAAVMHNVYIFRDFTKLYAEVVRAATAAAKHAISASKDKKPAEAKPEGEVNASAIITGDDLLNEANDYIQGCAAGSYELDEELFVECADYILEAAKKKADKKGKKVVEDELDAKLADKKAAKGKKAKFLKA